MSSDLWAAFGSPPGADQGPPSNEAQQSQTLDHNVQSGKSEDEKWETDSWSAVNEALESAWTGSQQQVPFAQPSVATHPINPPSSFPALTAEEDDDFGDFEEPEGSTEPPSISYEPSDSVSAQKAPVVPTEDLDDFGDFAEAEPGSDHHEEPFPSNEHGHLSSLKSGTVVETSQERSASDTLDFDTLIDFADSNPKGSIPPAAKEVPILQAESDSENNEDDWDDLGSASSKLVPATVTGHGGTRSIGALKGVGKQDGRKARNQNKPFSSGNMPPPSNIPPPSVLMYIICGLIPELPETIRITIVETWEEDEADVTKHMGTIQVAARILAGRKLRWKRDTILSQSMKMGMAGRQGGMKLAGVDRAEMQREDREAAEVVRIWRQHLGVIRTALAESSSAGGKPKPLPAISESAVVRTAKTDEGGITAPRCCVLCGLKRDERVDKVDREVWDQFGEWWTDHWGHRACKAFWDEYESRLHQR